MKPQDKKKGPRVLANVVKKQEKSFTTSGNNSFLNKSFYINALRVNNAKLAHSLALEKKKLSASFKRYNDLQMTVMQERAQRRSIQDGFKAGVKYFKDALELMIEAQNSFQLVNELISESTHTNSLEPQASTATTQSVSSGQGQPVVEISDILKRTNNSLQALSPGERTSSSSVRQCTARPMVKGQVISNPTISLQRLAIPARALGRPVVSPARGLELNMEFEQLPRLSDVAEELDGELERTSNTESATVETYSLSHEKPSSINAHSPNNPAISLPPSHVLLERISANIGYPLSELSPGVVDNDSTSVFFGALNFSTSNLELSHVPCLESEETTNNTHPADENDSEFETESSSDDENLALQIAESKKYYLERTRRLESMEGTSWNYDEYGKFREQPPRTGKAGRRVKRRMSSKKSKRKVEDTLSQTNSMGKSSMKWSGSTNYQIYSDGVAQTSASLDSSNTDHNIVDMSLTCEVPGKDSNVCQPSVPSNREEEELNECVGIKPLDETTAFITLRSRALKAPSFNLNASPVSCPKSPDCLRLSDSHRELSAKSSFVMLERLPSNITYRSHCLSPTHEERMTKTKILAHQEQQKCSKDLESLSEECSPVLQKRRALKKPLSVSDESSESPLNPKRSKESSPSYLRKRETTPLRFSGKLSDNAKVHLKAVVQKDLSSSLSPANPRGSSSPPRKQINFYKKSPPTRDQPGLKTKPLKTSASLNDKQSPAHSKKHPRREAPLSDSSADESFKPLRRLKSKKGSKQGSKSKGCKKEDSQAGTSTKQRANAGIRSQPRTPDASSSFNSSLKSADLSCKDEQDRRPRRNAAPTNMKEPELHRKLRRP